jgi:hypothetical protein
MKNIDLKKLLFLGVTIILCLIIGFLVRALMP